MKWKVSRILWVGRVRQRRGWSDTARPSGLDRGRGVDATHGCRYEPRGPRGSLMSPTRRSFEDVMLAGGRVKSTAACPQSLSRRLRSGMRPYPCGDHDDIS